MQMNVNDTINIESLDLLWGVKLIAREIGRPERAVFHLLSSGELPAQKVGGRWVASRHGLREYFGKTVRGVTG